MSDFKNYLFERFIKNHKRLKKLISLTGYCKQDDMYWGSSDNYEQYVSYEVWKYQQARVDELQKQVDALKVLAQTFWEKSSEKHKQGKVWESKSLGECADEILDELEQALKGD